MYQFLLPFIITTSVFSIDFTLTKQDLYNELEQYDKTKQVSYSKEWRVISGWKNTYFSEESNNKDIRGFASIKGMKSSKEDFIDFAIEYINPHISTVENSIKCRTPNKYLFMKSLFKDFISPLEQDDIKCKSIDNGFLGDLEFIDPFSHKSILFNDINISSVKGFELLYATPGTADASEVAGHLLLRIKFGKEIRNDIVISFLANTDPKNIYKQTNKLTMQEECTKNWFNIVDNNNFNAYDSIIQSLYGLSGGFLTMMDRQTLGETIKHYTVEEDRNLLRYELILTDKQKKDLLDKLFTSKKNYNSKYYFFTQNCASVLIKVIAQGIKVEEIATFNPLISAPNTLVAMFLRLGLAKPIYPSFFSYRTKAYMAQDALKIMYLDLTFRYKSIQFPNITKIINKSFQNRLDFIEELKILFKEHNYLNEDLWKLLNLIQESEMAYEYKDLYCKRYTSKLISIVREFQSILIKDRKSYLNKSFDISQHTKKSYQYTNESYDEGVPFTGLLPLSLGYGKYNDKDIVHIETSLIKQYMGSISNVSMQRGNSLELATISTNINQENKLINWKFKLLGIDKFQERLSLVPSYFSSSGTIGLGLNLLDYRGNYIDKTLDGTIIGGELLFNIIGSKNYNNYIYASLGLNLQHKIYNNGDIKGLCIPYYIQSLVTFGIKRKFQWQNKISFSNTIDNDLYDKFSIDSEIRYKFEISKQRLYILKSTFRYENLQELQRINKSILLGFELRQW